MLFSGSRRTHGKRKSASNGKLQLIIKYGVLNLYDYQTLKAQKCQRRHKKLVLQNAGLGCKKIQFNLNFNIKKEVYAEVISDEKVLDSDETVGFPKLKDCGGFEYMKCVPNCRLLQPSKEHISARTLKTVVGQGKIYIRPIQKILSVLPLKSPLSTTNFFIKERCMRCDVEFPINCLKEHVLVCKHTTQPLANSDDYSLDSFDLPSVFENNNPNEQPVNNIEIENSETIEEDTTIVIAFTLIMCTFPGNHTSPSDTAFLYHRVCDKNIFPASIRSYSTW